MIKARAIAQQERQQQHDSELCGGRCRHATEAAPALYFERNLDSDQSDSDSGCEDNMLVEEQEIIILQPVPFDISSLSESFETVESTQEKFNNLFAYGKSVQEHGASKLKGLRERAGFGESDRNKRRELAVKRDLVEENSKSVAVDRMLQRHCLCNIFHCEVNWIEYYWGKAKRYARDNCGYTIDALRQTVPKAVESVDSRLIGKYFRKSMRIMNAYREGLQYGGKESEQTVYKSHRRVQEPEGG